MQYILSILTHDTTPLPQDLPEMVLDSLSRHGIGDDGHRWLSPDIAFEVAFEAEASPNRMADLKAEFAGLTADITILPAKNRRKKLLIADMDCTIITSESLNDLAELSGFGEEVAQITARTMAGELDFGQSLMARMKIIAGSDAGLIQKIIDDAELSEGAEALVATMNHHGARTILASGGFTFLTEVIGKRLGFDEHYANQMVIEDGKITGDLIPPLLDQNAKATRLQTTIAEMGIAAEDVATIGDGANDRGMTELAGLGTAFRGKDALKAVATARLDHADLRGLLWLQGYHDDEIVT